jgi:hypothetical protein
MPHQMKGNGRHDVSHMLLDTWKNIWKWSDEVKYSLYIHNMWILCELIVIFKNYFNHSGLIVVVKYYHVLFSMRFIVLICLLFFCK